VTLPKSVTLGARSLLTPYQPVVSLTSYLGGNDVGEMVKSWIAFGVRSGVWRCRRFSDRARAIAWVSATFGTDITHVGAVGVLPEGPGLPCNVEEWLGHGWD
jgi:hypothetical protein